jgi:hypothetical protein
VWLKLTSNCFAWRCKQLFSLAAQHHEWLAGCLLADFDVLPAELRADAGAEDYGIDDLRFAVDAQAPSQASPVSSANG